MLPLNKLNKAARWALLSHFLWWVGETVGDTFVSIYTVRLTEGFAEAGWIQLWKYAGVPFGFLLGASLARKFSGIQAYRIGIAGYILFYAFVLGMGEHLLEWKFALGLVWGLAMGLYWLGWQLMVLDLTHDRERDTLLSLVGVGLFTAQLIGPPIAGFYLSSSGNLEAYGPLFAVVTLLLVFSALVTWNLKTRPLNREPGFIYLLKIKWKPEWKASLITFFFQGFQAVMGLFLAPMLAYAAMGSEMGAGSFSGAIAAVGLGVSLLASHILKPTLRKRSMFFASIALSATALILTRDITFVSLMAYGVLGAMIRPFFGPPFFATQQRIVTDSAELADRRADWLALRDFPIAFGRVIAALLVIYFVKDLSADSLRWFVLILVVTPLISYRLMRPYVDGSPPGPEIARPQVPESS